MKKYIIWSLALFVLAAVLAVVVFFMISFSENDPIPAIQPQHNTIDSLSDPGSESVAEDAPAFVSEFIIPPEGFPLRMLPLTEAHLKALSAAGVDVETYMITPQTLECAVQKIGQDRVAYMVGGNAPTVIEMVKLIPCL